MHRLFALIALLLVGGTAHADPLELEGNFIQGGLVRGHVPPGSEVRFAGRRLRVDQQGRFVFGFGRDEAPAVSLIVRYPDGTEAKQQLEVARREYEVQRINGLPPGQVTPSAKDLVRIRADARLIRAAMARDTTEAGFAEAFIWPVTGPISGVYGSQRISERQAAPAASRRRRRGARGHADRCPGRRGGLAGHIRHVLHRRHGDDRPWPWSRESRTPTCGRSASRSASRCGRAR